MREVCRNSVASAAELAEQCELPPVAECAFTSPGPCTGWCASVRPSIFVTTTDRQGRLRARWDEPGPTAVADARRVAAELLAEPAQLQAASDGGGP